MKQTPYLRCKTEKSTTMLTLTAFSLIGNDLPMAYNNSINILHIL